MYSFQYDLYNLACLFNSLHKFGDFGCHGYHCCRKERYGLPSYQSTAIYKMEKCHLLSIATVTICMSVEPLAHQHSETDVTILNFGLWIELLNKK